MQAMNIQSDLPKDTLRDFVYDQARKRGLTFREIGAALGMKPAYFSDLMTGRKRRSVEFLNELADHLNVPRVEIYKAAGLLQVTEYEALKAKLENLLANEPTVRQALDMLVNLEREDMLVLASWLIVNSVQLMQMRSNGENVPKEAQEIQAFPENSKLIPPAFMNMLYQIIGQYFKIGSKGQLLPKMSKREAEEYDGIETDFDEVEKESDEGSK